MLRNDASDVAIGTQVVSKEVNNICDTQVVVEEARKIGICLGDTEFGLLGPGRIVL